MIELHDIQDGLMCWRKGIYILWFTSFPYNKDSGERCRALLVCDIDISLFLLFCLSDEVGGVDQNYLNETMVFR